MPPASSTLSESGSGSKVLRIHAFPKGQDVWRIDWFGSISFPDRLTRRNNPSVLVYLSRVSVPHGATSVSAVATTPTRQVKRWVTVGTTMLLRIGDLWQNQTLFARPTHEQATFADMQIDPGTSTLIKAGLSLEGNFLLPLAQCRLHQSNTHSYCICVNLADGRRLVVPCMELIRFYFGSSSTLLSRLFAPPLQRNHLYRSAAQIFPGHLKLHLADGMPAASGEDIARIAASRKAWHAAVLVGTSCLKSSTTGSDDIYPQGIFPFEGQTTLKARGTWLPFGDKPEQTFLAYQLLSCSHAFPFDWVDVTYDASRRRPRHTRVAGPNCEASRPSTRSTAAKSPTLVESDPSSALAPHTAKVETSRKFPDLDRVLICRLVQLTAASPRKPSAAIAGIDEHAVGEPGSTRRIRPIAFEEYRKGDRKEPPNFLRPLVAALDLLGPPQFEITLLTASAEDGWTVPAALSSDEDGVIDARLLLPEEGDRARRVAVFYMKI